MEHPAAPPELRDEEAELAMMVAYLRDLQKRKFFGTVEVTFQAGELKMSREIRTRSVGSLASDLWAQIPARAHDSLKEKLKSHKGFVVD